MEMPRSGNGSGLGEEVGVAGSGTMMSISVLPPSLPESSSTSAESLGIGHDGDGLQIHFGNRGVARNIYIQYIHNLLYNTTVLNLYPCTVTYILYYFSVLIFS